MIDPSLIPEEALMELIRTLHKDAIRFYQDPKNVEAYEKWKEEREKMEKEKQSGLQMKP